MTSSVSTILFPPQKKRLIKTSKESNDPPFWTRKGISDRKETTNVVTKRIEISISEFIVEVVIYFIPPVIIFIQNSPHQVSCAHRWNFWEVDGL